MHKSKPVLEYEKHKILRLFEMQMDHSDPSRRSDRMLINKKK